MSEHDDRESWLQIPDHPEYWASTLGRVAKMDPGGGFQELVQSPNVYGLMTVKLNGDGRPKTALVGSLVLKAFGHPRPDGYRIEHDDGDPANCTPGNLRWAKKGCEPVRDLKERKCLGRGCDVVFPSNGPGNRLCPSCTYRLAREGDSGLDDTESGELPEEPICGTGGKPHR